MYYYSLNEYLKSKYGSKVYKLAISGGMTCPNRDGTLGIKGCIFCSGAGSGDFAASVNKSISMQIMEARERISKKYKEGKYIAYFQAFTNTYAPVSYLEKIFMEAIEIEDIVGISIATRPDCLGDEVLELLSRLNKIKPVWVELGLQTIHERTAAYIRRGYDLACYDRAVFNLRQLGIEVIVHVILGLPNETKEDMLATVEYVGNSHVQGIKLQLLHVLKGTDLAQDYLKGKFSVFTLEEYVDILEACVRSLPPEMVIHRLRGDGPKRLLIAPAWSGNKKLVLNTVQQEFQKRNVVQGSNFHF